MHSPFTLAIMAGIGLYILHAIRQRISNFIFARKHGCKSTGPTYDFFGLRRIYELVTYALSGRYMDYGEDLVVRHGRNTIPMTELGSPGIFTVDPRNVQSILATNFKSWGIGTARHPLLRFLGDGIFTQDGESWAHSRALVRPSFTKTQIADFDSLEEHTQELFIAIEQLGVATADGLVEIDVKPLFSDLTMDFASVFLFGETAHALKHRREGRADQGLAHHFDRGMYHTTISFFLGWMHWAWRPKEFRESSDFVHKHVDGFVTRALEAREKMGEEAEKERVERVGGRYLFLNALTAAEQDRLQLRSQVLNILLAGRDTTASLLSWMLWTLARKPEAFERLRKEIDTTLGTGSNSTIPDWQVLKDMKFLQAVITETLRLHPSVPISNRAAQVDTTLPYGGGPDESAPVFISKGSTVNYSIYGMHRRKDLWGEDASEFRPERWMQADTGKKMREIGWGYLPFSGGPRICPGQQFALTEASYVLVRLMQRYESILKMAGTSDVAIHEANLVSPPSGGVWVTVKPYKV